jgi:hypothetical protein
MQDVYGDGLTTVMLTRRVSPLDEDGEWITPWESGTMLNGGSVRRDVGRRLNYHLGDLEYEYAAVTAPTNQAGTPHEHILLWINDPKDTVDTTYIKPALDKHLDACDYAYEKHHRYRADGTGGAITYRHDPERIDAPERIADGHARQTKGAQYLASQLAHLPLGDYYDSEKDDPARPLIEGAALAWASPNRWFRSSSGV